MEFVGQLQVGQSQFFTDIRQQAILCSGIGPEDEVRAAWQHLRASDADFLEELYNQGFCCAGPAGSSNAPTFYNMLLGNIGRHPAPLSSQLRRRSVVLSRQRQGTCQDPEMNDGSDILDLFKVEDHNYNKTYVPMRANVAPLSKCSKIR